MQDFYEDIFYELSKYGEIDNLVVCANMADHMVSEVVLLSTCRAHLGVLLQIGGDNIFVMFHSFTSSAMCLSCWHRCYVTYRSVTVARIMLLSILPMPFKYSVFSL